MADLLQIAIVDDHPLFREGVAFILDQQPDLEVVAQGASAADAVAIASQRLPDLMLLDVSMPGGGLNAVREIATAYPVVKVVMLTVSENEDDVTAALRAGARAYVLKGVAARELVGILRAVAAGDVYVTPTLAASLLYELTGAPKGRLPADPLGDLTEREDRQAPHDEHPAEVAGPQPGRGGADGARRGAHGIGGSRWRRVIPPCLPHGKLGRVGALRSDSGTPMDEGCLPLSCSPG
jgi:DNA-binding NarL/FixJ family response regulator